MSGVPTRTSARAGIAVPIVWFAVVATLTAVKWNYLHSLGWTFTDHGDVNYPSSTATGDWGFVQALNFLVTGALMGVFLVGFRRQLVRRWSGWVATVGLGAAAVSGVFSAFPTDLPGDEQSWHGILHGIGFLALVFGLVVGFAASGLALRGNPDWRGWRWLGWTPVAMALSVSGLVLPEGLGFYLFMLLAFGWFAVMGARLLQLSSARGRAA